MAKQLLVKLWSSKGTYGFGSPPVEEWSAIIVFLHDGPTLYKNCDLLEHQPFCVFLKRNDCDGSFVKTSFLVVWCRFCACLC